MNKNILWGFVTIYVFFSNLKPIFAARILPRYQKTSKNISRSSNLTFAIRPWLRADRRALNLYFSGLTKVRSVSYMLIYQSNGIDKGVGGSINLTGSDAVNRELLFGTESSGVYRYDENISNMRLEVTTEYLNGKKTLKKYKIKV